MICNNIANCCFVFKIISPPITMEIIVAEMIAAKEYFPTLVGDWLMDHASHDKNYFMLYNRCSL